MTNRIVILSTVLIFGCAATASLAQSRSDGGVVLFPIAPTVVTFGTDVGGGAPFLVNVTATGFQSAPEISLFVGLLPAGVTDIVISPTSALRPAQFTITGNVSYALNHRTVHVPIVVANNIGGSTAGSFALIVIPEPSTMNALAAVALGAARRPRRHCTSC